MRSKVRCLCDIGEWKEGIIRIFHYLKKTSMTMNLRVWFLQRLWRNYDSFGIDERKMETSHYKSTNQISARIVGLFQWFETGGSQEGSWITFGGVESRYFVYTSVFIGIIRVLDRHHWVILGCYNGSRCKKGWEHWSISLLLFNT